MDSMNFNDAGYLVYDDLGAGVAGPRFTDVHTPVWTASNRFAAWTGKKFCMQIAPITVGLGGNWSDYVFPSAENEFHVEFLMWVDSTLAAANFYNWQTLASSTQLMCSLNANGTITMTHGTTAVSTTSAMVANKIYVVHVGYKVGTGANGFGYLGFWDTKQVIYSGGNYVQTTAGTSTAAVGLADFENSGAGSNNIYFAGMKINRTRIGAFSR